MYDESLIFNDEVLTGPILSLRPSYDGLQKARDLGHKESQPKPNPKSWERAKREDEIWPDAGETR